MINILRFIKGFLVIVVFVQLHLGYLANLCVADTVIHNTTIIQGNVVGNVCSAEGSGECNQQTLLPEPLDSYITEPGERYRTFVIKKYVNHKNKLIFYYDLDSGLSMDLNGKSATNETMSMARLLLNDAYNSQSKITVYYLSKVWRNTGEVYELLTKIYTEKYGLLNVKRKYAIP